VELKQCIVQSFHRPVDEVSKGTTLFTLEDNEAVEVKINTWNHFDNRKVNTVLHDGKNNQQRVTSHTLISQIKIY